MKKRLRLGWYLVTVLVLGLALLAISCAGTATTPIEEEEVVEEEEVIIEEEEEAVEEEEEVSVGGPPLIPHTLEGRDDCLQCHGESGFMPFPADHAGRANDICTTCHQPSQ